MGQIDSDYTQIVLMRRTFVLPGWERSLNLGEYRSNRRLGRGGPFVLGDAAQQIDECLVGQSAAGVKQGTMLRKSPLANVMFSEHSGEPHGTVAIKVTVVRELTPAVCEPTGSNKDPGLLADPFMGLNCFQ